MKRSSFKTRRFRLFILLASILLAAGTCFSAGAKPLHPEETPVGKPAHSLPVASPAENGSLASYPPVPDTSIHAQAPDHTWASASGIEAGTYLGQLDEKIAFLEELYQRKKSDFILLENVTAQEAVNTAGISYLYAQSTVYRQMTEHSGFSLGSGDGTFSRSSDSPVRYERFVFSVESPCRLDLQISSKLYKGQMAFWLVSPAGSILLETDALTDMEENASVDVCEGLWSLITVSHFDAEGQMEGEFSVRGGLTTNPD